MRLNNRVYDVLKWITLIALPAFGTAYFSLAGIWNFPFPEEVSKTILVITALLGALLGLSTATYNRSESAYDGKLVLQNDDPERDVVAIKMNLTPEELAAKKEVRVKVDTTNLV